MAVFVKNKNELTKKLSQARRDILISSILIIISAGLSIVLFPLISYFATAPLLITIYCIVQLTFNVRNGRILRSGLDGEKRTQKVLRMLPKEYYIHSDLHVEYEGRESQLDHVIVGPTGIYVVESKNMNGVIKGDGNDRRWIQHKTGKGGGRYENEFYSPVKQVGTHVYRLAGILKENGINQWINSCVFFSNYKTKVDIEGNDIPVYGISTDGGENLVEYILSEKRSSLTKSEIDKINNIIIEKC